MLAIIAGGKTASVEFKRCGSVPEADTHETVCTFANYLGGGVFLGVSDDGAIAGVPDKAVADVQRNIANVFTQMGLAEELGSGTRNLFKYARSLMGADPSLVDGTTFWALVPDALGVLGGEPATGSSRASVDDAILALAASAESFTLGQAAEAAGVSKRSASTHISTLVAAGKIVGKGTTRDKRCKEVA